LMAKARWLVVAGRLLMIAIVPGVLVGVVVVQSGDCKSPIGSRRSPTSRSYSEHLQCEMGGVTVDMPIGWTCRKDSHAAGMEFYSNVDSGAIFISAASPIAGASNWSDRIRSENNQSIAGPPVYSSIEANNLSMYSVEGRSAKLRGMWRREGYVVGATHYASFAELSAKGTTSPPKAQTTQRSFWKQIRIQNSDRDSLNSFDDLVCTYGNLSLNLPNDWRCSEDSRSQRILLTFDKSQKTTIIAVWRPMAIAQDAHGESYWKKLCQEGNELTVTTVVANPSSARDDRVVAYFVEEPLNKKGLTGMRKTSGYLVAKSTFAKFAEIWPDVSGEERTLLDAQRSQALAAIGLE
jgi:hypothetical protein